MQFLTWSSKHKQEHCNSPCSDLGHWNDWNLDPVFYSKLWQEHYNTSSVRAWGWKRWWLQYYRKTQQVFGNSGSIFTSNWHSVGHCTISHVEGNTMLLWLGRQRFLIPLASKQQRSLLSSSLLPISNKQHFKLGGLVWAILIKLCKYSVQPTTTVMAIPAGHKNWHTKANQNLSCLCRNLSLWITQMHEVTPLGLPS